MPDFLSKILFLQGNQLECLLDIDVIVQQKAIFEQEIRRSKG